MFEFTIPNCEIARRVPGQALERFQGLQRPRWKGFTVEGEASGRLAGGNSYPETLRNSMTISLEIS